MELQEHDLAWLNIYNFIYAEMKALNLPIEVIKDAVATAIIDGVNDRKHKNKKTLELTC